MPSFSATGLLDLRVALTGKSVSWEDRGLGKTRFGAATDGNNRVIARIAEASLIVKGDLTWDISGVAHVIAGAQQEHPIDLVEAYLDYHPVPTSRYGIRGRAGAFFPTISLENTGLGWTSPFTISSSAINSWVGEELRTFGAELTAFRTGDDIDVSLTGSVYYANDPAGTILTWRGWAIHDRKSGIFEKIPLAPVRIIRPGGILDNQAPYVAPLAEIDDRAGYYVGANVEHHDFGSLHLLYYDNSADDREIEGGQWAWLTRFLSVGLKTELPANVDLVAQYLKGRTSVITIPPPTGPISRTHYDSLFFLVSKTWGQHRVSARWEHFATHDRDRFPDNNSETGHGLTLAYVFYPVAKQRLTLELLHVRADRPERTLSFNLPAKWHDTQIQASYRFFF
ncbi:MAG: hypothetical protein KDE14_06180 [Rhodobacteraceae bacterium]|nr:hypothetical protein [Paracoccaceae bacterium]